MLQNVDEPLYWSNLGFLGTTVLLVHGWIYLFICCIVVTAKILVLLPSFQDQKRKYIHLHYLSQYWHSRWLTLSCVVSELGSVTVIHHVDLLSPLGNCMWLSCAFAHTPHTSWQPVSFLSGGYVCSFENREWYTFMYSSETKCFQSSREKSVTNHEAQPVPALQSHQL